MDEAPIPPSSFSSWLDGCGAEAALRAVLVLCCVNRARCQHHYTTTGITTATTASSTVVPKTWGWDPLVGSPMINFMNNPTYSISVYRVASHLESDYLRSFKTVSKKEVNILKIYDLQAHNISFGYNHNICSTESK